MEETANWIDWIRLLSTLAFGLTTATLAFMAYKYNLERMRLELSERRWEMLELITQLYGVHLGFCVAKQKKTPVHIKSQLYSDSAAALKGLRQIEGKVNMLYGNEVYKLYEEYKDFCSNESEKYETQKPELDDALLVKERQIIGRIKEALEPYLYFGGYKKASN